MGADMGRVLTEATMYNLHDRFRGNRVRTAVVSDAVVDERIPYLVVPRDIIEQLGLSIRSTAWAGLMSDAVSVEIMGREATCDARVVPEGEPVRIGFSILTWMDWVVDVKGKKLIGNPAHGGEHILELL